MCGRIVQSTNVRSSIKVRLSEVIPIPNTVLALEASGVMLGIIFFGNRLLIVARRSATTCLFL